MTDPGSPPAAPIYAAGDILLEEAEGGTYQVSRVSANGRTSYVLGFQRNQPAALLMAARATSGFQRVFMRIAAGSDGYRLVVTS
ncbi:MAG TPA: hypothetical protein VJN96_24865 [Vicinamibacterales bacterium]|nr:hypothetical protein [Vicinamibacterales bacterium]